MKTIGLKLLTAATTLLLAAGVAAQDTKPNDLIEGNLFSNPGFSGENCYEHWEPKIQTDKGTICKYPGSVWLNHNNKAGDPALAQTVSGLDTSKEYILEASWRPGATASVYVKSSEPLPIFAIMIGDERKTYSANMDDKEFKTVSYTFKPSIETMTFEFQGEADNYDGDVALQWVSLRPIMSPEDQATLSKIPDVSTMMTAAVSGKIVPSSNAYFFKREGQAAFIRQGQQQASKLKVVKNGNKVSFQDADNPSEWVSIDKKEKEDVCHSHMLSFTTDPNQKAEFYVRSPKMEECGDGSSAFCVQPEDLFVSYESVSEPDHYLRHCGYKIGLKESSANPGIVEIGDMTWRVEQAK